MNPKAIKLTSKIDQIVSDIVSHMALPTADPKIKNQLARYVKGQILSLLTQVDVKDSASLNTVLLNHFDTINKGDN